MIEADFEAHIDLVRQSIPTVTDAIADAATVVSSALGRGGQLTGKFGIRHTPASVATEGEMLRVTEHVLKGGRQ